MEVKVGKKKCFITSLYRSPAVENNSPESVNEFINKLECTLNKIEGKNPYISLLLVILMQKNTKWWGNVNDNLGVLLDEVSTHHSLHQMIDQPTYFRPGCSPS